MLVVVVGQHQLTYRVIINIWATRLMWMVTSWRMLGHAGANRDGGTMPHTSRKDKAIGPMTLGEWRRREEGWEQRPRPWWEAGREPHAPIRAEGSVDQEHAEAHEHAEDTERLREEHRQREGSRTRKWRDMTGDRPLEAPAEPVGEEPELPPRRRLVRVGNRPRT
jgi:hypothetical protein